MSARESSGSVPGLGLALADADTRLRPGAPTTFIDVLRRHAAGQPDAPSYTFLKDGEVEAGRRTFGALDRRARAIAARLQNAGLTGERAILVYPSGLDFVEALFGCLYAGVVAVPASLPRPNRPAHRFHAIAADARARVALTTRATHETSGRWSTAPDGGGGLEWLVTDEVDDAGSDSWVEPDIGAAHLALLQYTSGSTAVPRGVMVTHANLLQNERMVELGFGHDRQTIFVSWLPIAHDMGLIGMLLQPMYLGIHCIFMPPSAFLQKPVRWLRAISDYRATTSGAPNFAYDLCARRVTEEERAGLDLSTWSVAYSGAEPVRAETLDRFTEVFRPALFRGDAFYPCYGLAEATLIASGGQPRTPPVVVSVDGPALERHEVRVVPRGAAGSRRLVGCGGPLLDGAIVVADPETRSECARGRVGEIWVSGRSVAVGYFGRPEDTEATFGAVLSEGRGPFLRTGDLGFVTDGELFVTGRLKDLIIVRGQNHYPHDIEQTVEQSHPALLPGGSAAFAIETGTEVELVAVAEVDRRQRRELAESPAGAGLASAVRQAVAERHDLALGALVLLRPGGLPKTTSGKVQRPACRAAYLRDELEPVAVFRWQEDDGDPAAPQSPAERRNLSTDDIETWLTTALAGQAGVDPSVVDVRAPFARYGLSSLMAVTLTDDLGRWLGRDLDATLLWDYPTIEAVARHLAGPAHASGPSGQE